MAEKRMFTMKIVDSDSFLEMPLSTQALYFHLNMRADDDGFVNSPKKISRMVGASDDDLKILILKRFVIGFDSGVIVIKHWRMHNTLKSDRYHPTDYQEEFAALGIKSNKAYTDKPEMKLLPDAEPPLEPECVQNGSNMEPERNHRIDLDLGLDSGLEKDKNLTVSDETVCCTSDVQRVIDAWNSLGLQTIKKIVPGSDRDKWLKKRIRDYGIDDVLDAIEKVRQSSFLMGNNKNGWQATFDWFIRPNNFPKVLSGNYDNRPAPAQQTKAAAELDGSYHMMEKWRQKHDTG